MPKKNIHPKMYDLEIVMPNGEKLITKSTSNKGSLKVAISLQDHPAWNRKGRTVINKASERIEGFNKRFGGISAFDLED